MSTTTIYSVLPLTSKFYDDLRGGAAEGAAGAELAAVRAVLSAYLREEGGAVVKVVHCRRHYSAALLSGGALVLLCPGGPAELHGARLRSDGERVTDVAAGDTHLVYCTARGAVFSCGYSNDYGQLGDGTVWRQRQPPEEAPAAPPPPLSEPRRLPHFGDSAFTETLDNAQTYHGPQREPPGVAAVACGAQHTLLLTAAGNAVYACGRGHRGQLGGPRCVPLQPSPRCVRLLFGLPLAQVAAAGDHSFARLRTGKLLAWGDNAAGQLGMGHARQVLTPTPVTFLGANEAPEAAAEAPGGRARRVVADGRLYGALRAGYASPAAVQFPLRVQRITPEAEAGLPAVAEVVCGPTLTLLRTDAGEWYSCGLAPSVGKAAEAAEAAGGGRGGAEAAVIAGDNAARRYDGHGVLGRPLLRAADSQRFGRMCWSAALASLGGPPPRCLCFPQAAVALAGEEAADTPVRGAGGGPRSPLDVSPAGGAGDDTQRNSLSDLPAGAAAQPTARGEGAGAAGGRQQRCLRVQSGVATARLEVRAASGGRGGVSITRIPPDSVGGRAAADAPLLLAAGGAAADADDSLEFRLEPGCSVIPLRECIMIM